MKIGIDGSSLIKPQPTGVEAVTRELIHALLQLDVAHQYILYTQSALPESFGQYSHVINRVIPPARFWTQTALSNAIVGDKLDIWWSPSNLLPRHLPSKVLATIHDLAFMKFPWAYTWRAWLGSWFTVKRARRFATKIIAVSQQTKTDLIKYFRTPLDQVTVIYNALPRPDESISPDRPRLPEEFILVVGRVEPRKNPLNTIHAFAEVARAHPALQLVFAGPAGASEPVRDLAQEYGLADRVLFLGFVSAGELENLYRRAKLLLFPSLYEGFGLPILEAFAHDLPVVTSNLGALREIAGEAAELIEPTSPSNIADGVRRLLDNPDAKAQYVAMGRERLRDFSWNRSARQLLDLINSL